MPFKTRPFLGNNAFQQSDDEILNLSGTTDFKGILKSKGIEIDATVTDSVLQEGQPLVFDGSKISLQPLSGSSGIYNGASPSTISLGGVSSGTVLTGRTIESIIQELLVVYQNPSFTSFSIAGFQSTYEVGNPASFSGNQTFNWNTSQSGNVEPNSIVITDVTNSTTLASGLSNDSTESLGIGTIQNTTPISQTWRISASNTQSSGFQRNYGISSLYPWFYGTVASGGAAGGDNRPTASQQLLTNSTKVLGSSNGTITANFGATSDDYLWFAIPSSSTLKQGWKLTELNKNNIGGAVTAGGNLFPDPVSISINSPSAYWGGIQYDFYISNYQNPTSSTMSITNNKQV